MLRYRRVGLVALATVAVVSLASAAPATLNPLVPRSRDVQGPVPADCVEGLVPAPQPRVAVRDIPLPEIEPAAAAAQAPPSASLRGALQDAQAALARNDRPAFDDALGRARSLMNTYPSGAERRTAEEALRIYDTTARLWDAQFQSPFFDEASSEFQLMSGYPGWSEAVRRSTITDPSGRRFYPAAESRDFLSRVAADRLRGLGLQAPVRVARAEQPQRTPAVSQPRRSTTTPSTGSRSTASSSGRTRTSTTTRRSTARPSTRTASATGTTTTRASRPRLSSAPAHPRLSTETRTPAPVTTAPGTPDPQASPTTAAAPEPAAPAATSPGPAAASPAAGGTDLTPVGDPTPIPDAGTATTPPPPTETAVTPAPTTSNPIPPAEGPSRSRSVILPAILILIGLGVLIVLFRASK